MTTPVPTPNRANILTKGPGQLGNGTRDTRTTPTAVIWPID